VTAVKLEAEALPTPLAQVVRRMPIAKATEGAEFFLTVSYVAETAIKLLGIAIQAGLREKAPEQSYRMAYDMVRADGLGIWESWIRLATSQPLAGFLPPAFNDLVSWATKVRTKQEDDWFREAVGSLDVVFTELGIVSNIPERKPTVRDLIAALVQVRNKTKAHGAVGEDFFLAVNDAYEAATSLFVVECPLFRWRWMNLSQRPNGKNRGIILLGNNPRDALQADIAPLHLPAPGVHIWPSAAIHPISCSELLRSNHACTTFLLPNGGFRNSEATFIDYSSGKTALCDVSPFVRPPAPLPRSDTHGMETFDIQSNVFGNLPSVPIGYVKRHQLESELDKRLRDKNHPIVTLHGRGGIGKTSLALRVAHNLAQEDEPVFDHIVWLSARDIDLRPHGPMDVQPAVVTLERVSEVYGALFATAGTVEAFADALHRSVAGSAKGVLFIFDNFETMESLRGIQEFLDTHTHLPNKVLITSRERDFKADFPIEVRGMERPEATELISAVAQELGIEDLVSDEVVRRVFEYSEGHPYVIRVIMGEMAKEGRYVPPKSLLPRRIDIVDAVFERSFNKLSPDGRRVFLTVGSWKSIVSELALLVVLGRENVDVERGIEECVRLSLIERKYFLDEQPGYVAPQLARLFAAKKLEGDSDRPLIQGDLQILQRFGVIPTAQPVQIPQDEAIQKFVERCLQEAPTDADDGAHLDSILVRLAEMWPKGWLPLAQYRLGREAAQEDIEYALRRSVEETPSSKESHLLRAQYAWSVGDEATFIASRLRAVEVDPSDHHLLREVALEVCKYINSHSSTIPRTRRGIYLASLRDHMSKEAHLLDATGFSRLAWLFLLEENTEMAAKYAKRGLALEPENEHCQKIIERLERGRS
jgi:hypothetical protein